MSPTEKRRDDEKGKPEPPERKPSAKESREDELDEALEETFPASDPPAATQPHPRKRSEDVSDS